MKSQLFVTKLKLYRRSGILAFGLFLLLGFQNCGQYSSVPLELEAAVDQAEGASQSAGEVTDRWDNRQGGEVDSLSCPVASGAGIKVNQAGKQVCKATKCDKGFELKAGSCEFKTVRQACEVANGTGERVNSGTGFGPCQVQSCDSGYGLKDGQCKFVKSSRSCPVANGEGTQINDGGGWSTCRISTCNSGFHPSQGKCVSNERRCSIAHGQGVERYRDGQWRECVADQCAQSYEKWSGLCVKKSAPTARVNFFILRQNNGAGNDRWTPEFVADVIKELTLLTEGNVKFVLNQKKNIKNTADYNTPQNDVGPRYLHHKRFGEIGVLVPKACGGDALGINHNFEPFFVVNGCHYPSHLAIVRDAARNILHELGHNMGMRHDYDNPVNMDTHYFLEPGILVNYVRDMNACTTSACQRNNRK